MNNFFLSVGKEWAVMERRSWQWTKGIVVRNDIIRISCLYVKLRFIFCGLLLSVFSLRGVWICHEMMSVILCYERLCFYVFCQFKINANEVVVHYCTWVILCLIFVCFTIVVCCYNIEKVLKQSPFAEAVLVAEKTTACPDLAFPEVPVSAPLRSLLWAPRRSQTLLPLRRFQMFLPLRRM